MIIENNKEEVPFSHYAALFAAEDPAEISARLGVPFADGGFTVTLLGREYRVSHPECAVTCPGGQAATIPIPVQTFLLRWLLEGKPAPWQGQWKTFREMPWGELYIKPYTGRVLTRAAFTFGTRLDAFRGACEKLGGLPLKSGDAGYEFDFLDSCRIRVLVWAGDEEFPPSAQVLYSDNFAQSFAPEDRVVAGDILISHIKSAM